MKNISLFLTVASIKCIPAKICEGAFKKIPQTELIASD